MDRLILVIPCFNEAERIRRDDVAKLIAEGGVDVLLVDDGSSDRTAEVLREIERDLGPRVASMSLPANVGKAEAVRAGLAEAVRRGAWAAGYTDADFSTPPAELLRLAAVLREGGATGVLGCRLARLGADVRRSAARHYTGRVFATIASWAVAAPVYDTQCGAKVFRVDDALREAIGRPFASRWAFDVELIGRLMNAREAAGGGRLDGLVEIPLLAWHDVRGSKLGLAAAVRATLELVAIGRALRRERAASRVRR